MLTFFQARDAFDALVLNGDPVPEHERAMVTVFRILLQHTMYKGDAKGFVRRDRSSVEVLARLAVYSPKKVGEALADLEAGGFIKRRRRPRGNGGSDTQEIYLSWPAMHATTEPDVSSGSDVSSCSEEVSSCSEGSEPDVSSGSYKEEEKKDKELSNNPDDASQAPPAPQSSEESQASPAPAQGNLQDQVKPDMSWLRDFDAQNPSASTYRPGLVAVFVSNGAQRPARGRCRPGEAKRYL
jgi:hypothetical protein